MPDPAPTRIAGPRIALAFDYGRRRIGVAAGDTLTATAAPRPAVPAQAGVPDWSAIEREIRSVDPLIPISHVRTMDQVMASSIGRQNFNMTLLTVFAAIALLLASIGIYGLMSYSVEQRAQEIGIRLALGASQREMLRMVVFQGLKLAIVGVVIGLAAAFGLTRLLGSMLFGVKSFDPVTFGAVAAVLAGVAALATYFPARHAAATEPVRALRQQ